MSDRPMIAAGIAADEEYWDALERGEFRISRCGGCQRWMWPANFRCGECGSWDVKWEPVAADGFIYAWTRNHMVSDVIKEWRDQLPYVTLMVELPHAGGIRVAGVLKANGIEPRIGDPVLGSIERPNERSHGHTTMAWTIDRERV